VKAPGSALGFQFFPSCCFSLSSGPTVGPSQELSILSQLLHDRARENVRRYLTTARVFFFQFFPSCCMSETTAASTRQTCLSILSQLLLHRCEVLAVVLHRDFQFFPSCCKSENLMNGSERSMAYALSILSQLLRGKLIPEAEIEEHITFNSFPVAAPSLLLRELESLMMEPFNSFPVAA
jgi:hypothetical protein